MKDSIIINSQLSDNLNKDIILYIINPYLFHSVLLNCKLFSSHDEMFYAQNLIDLWDTCQYVYGVIPLSDFSDWQYHKILIIFKYQNILLFFHDYNIYIWKRSQDNSHKNTIHFNDTWGFEVFEDGIISPCHQLFTYIHNNKYVSNYKSRGLKGSWICLSYDNKESTIEFWGIDEDHQRVYLSLTGSSEMIYC